MVTTFLKAAPGDINSDWFQAKLRQSLPEVTVACEKCDWICHVPFLLGYKRKFMQSWTVAPTCFLLPVATCSFPAFSASSFSLASAKTAHQSSAAVEQRRGTCRTSSRTPYTQKSSQGPYTLVGRYTYTHKKTHIP